MLLTVLDAVYVDPKVSTYTSVVRGLKQGGGGIGPYARIHYRLVGPPNKLKHIDYANSRGFPVASGTAMTIPKLAPVVAGAWVRL